MEPAKRGLLALLFNVGALLGHRQFVHAAL